MSYLSSEHTEAFARVLAEYNVRFLRGLIEYIGTSTFIERILRDFLAEAEVREEGGMPNLDRVSDPARARAIRNFLE